MKILFVDDKPVTHAYYRDELKKDPRYKNCEIELAFDLRDAIDILNKGGMAEINMVIVDLHLPDSDIPEELNSYYQKYGKEIRLNEGQLLGLYLRDKGKPYRYLSAYPNKYRKDWEQAPEPVCLSKEVTASEFINAL